MAKKKKRETLLRRLARLMKMIALGKHYKMPRKPRKREMETVRTKAITKRLKDAGLTKEEIARLKR